MSRNDVQSKTFQLSTTGYEKYSLYKKEDDPKEKFIKYCKRQLQLGLHLEKESELENYVTFDVKSYHIDVALTEKIQQSGNYNKDIIMGIVKKWLVGFEEMYVIKIPNKNGIRITCNAENMIALCEKEAKQDEEK